MLSRGLRKPGRRCSRETVERFLRLIFWEVVLFDLCDDPLKRDEI